MIQPSELFVCDLAEMLMTRCWDISIEYVLNDHDPRRFKPLVDFCINTALNADFTSGSAFDR